MPGGRHLALCLGQQLGGYAGAERRRVDVDLLDDDERHAVEWHTVVWDGLTAAVGIYYLTLRSTYGSLIRGAALFEDLKEKQRRALEINDNIVQGLVVAETALALDQKERSQEALEATLVAAREIISDLLGEMGTEVRLGAGDLRRSRPAVVGTDD